MLIHKLKLKMIIIYIMVIIRNLKFINSPIFMTTIMPGYQKIRNCLNRVKNNL
jgi:hypothetical protein